MADVGSRRSLEGAPGTKTRRLRKLAGWGVIGITFLYSIDVIASEFTRMAGQYGLPLVVKSTVAAFLPVPLYLAIILWVDRHEREPSSLIAAVFLWGAIVAAAISGWVNISVKEMLQGTFGSAAWVVSAVASAPVIEELSKGAVLLLLFLWKRVEFDNVLDGLIYGAVVGLGFAMAENISYFVRYSNELFGGGLAGLGAMFYIRVILFGFGHSMFTGMTGVGLGLARQSVYPVVKIMAPLTGLSAAMFFHGIWNASGAIPGLAGVRIPLKVELFAFMPLMVAVLALPGLLTLMAVAFLTWKHESQIITAYLQDEIATGAVTSPELAVVGNGPARRRRLLQTLRTRGLPAWLALRHLYDLQTELAFRKWHAQREEPMPAAQRATSEEMYLQQISALRQRLQAMEVATG